MSEFDIDEKQEKLYHDAGRGDMESVKELLALTGINIDWVYNKNFWVKENKTALHNATWNGHADMVQLLLDNGATVDALDAHNETPLHIAAAHGHAPVIEVLLRKGANVNAIEEHGRTALHIAAMHGFAEVAQVLLSIGTEVDIDIEDNKNWTALRYAADREYSEVVDAIIAVGVAVTDNVEYQGIYKQISRFKVDELKEFLAQQEAEERRQKEEENKNSTEVAAAAETDGAGSTATTRAAKEAKGETAERALMGSQSEDAVEREREV